jgi:hypothetical protein
MLNVFLFIWQFLSYHFVFNKYICSTADTAIILNLHIICLTIMSLVKLKEIVCRLNLYSRWPSGHGSDVVGSRPGGVFTILP